MEMLDDKVHVWKVPLDVATDEYGRLSCLLSFDERRRAEKFRFEKDRKQYVVSHGILRELLGGYLNCDPSRMSFGVTRFGKPYLSNCLLKFNLSHSSNMALVVIAMGVDVGIDVEAVRADLEYLDLAKSFFSQSEYRAILAAPAEDRILSFYRCWTGKEALVKAIGEGLSIPLDSFSISLGREASQAIRMNAEQSAPTHWTLRQIDVGRQYLGSLAYEGEERNVTCLDWNCSTDDAVLLKK